MVEAEVACQNAQVETKLTLEQKFENTKVMIANVENDYKNSKLALEFIKKCLVPDSISAEEAKMFIKYQMSEAFHFTGKTGNSMTKDNISNFVLLRKQHERYLQGEARKNGLNIDAKYNGMYTVEMNSAGNIVVLPHLDEIADMVVSDLYVTPYRDCLFCFKNGYYVNDIKAVESMATNIISEVTKLKNSKGVTTSLRDVMTLIAKNRVDDYPFRNLSKVLNVANGVLVFDNEGNFKLEEHDAEKHKFDYIFPIEYKPEVDSTKIMSELAKYSDKWEAIIQVLVQTMLQKMGYNPFKTGYLIYGPPDYGKTAILQIFNAFAGEEFVSQIALGRMSSEDKFSLAPLEGKTMNIKDELSYFRMTDTNTYKDITGSYKIWVEPKHIDAYTAYSTAVHVFATNRTPTFDSRVKDDEAFWKRWVIIACTKTRFPRNEKYVKEEILTAENMSGLLNEVLKRVTDYIKGNPLKYNSARDEEWVNVREEWLQAGSPLYKFITENMTRGGETAILKEELLYAVQEWCDKNLLYKKAKPETVNDLIDTIKLCNGTIDERRNFYTQTEAEMSEKIKGKEKTAKSFFLTEEKHCFVLPWTWNFESKYRANFRKTSQR